MMARLSDKMGKTDLGIKGPIPGEIFRNYGNGRRRN